MKVVIGPFKYRWTTNRLEDFWYRIRYGKEHNRWTVDHIDKWDNRVEKVFDFLQAILNVTINKLIDENKRKIKIKIDRYDIWGTDYHLALIILPMLQELRSRHHGAPFIDDEDVPEHLRSTAAPAKENDYDVDDNHFKRYEWLLDELIWTFTELCKEDGDSQFYDHSECDGSLSDYEKIKIDYDGLKAYNARISNGTTLFGKYLRALSD